MKEKILGYCRICGVYSQLTDDHVPPQGCGNKIKVKVYKNVNETITRQNGFSVKTLCSKCNNEILGAVYDKELIRVYKELLPLYRTKLYLTNQYNYLTINTEPFLKGLIGHILSCSFSNNSDSSNHISKPLSENDYMNTFRRYFNSETDNVRDYDIYYWYYPFKTIKIVPFFGLKTDFFISSSPLLFCTLIKFFPISVLFVNTRNSTGTLNFEKIDPYKKNQEIKLNMKKTINENWPEHPTQRSVIMMADNMHFHVEEKKC